MRLALRHSPGVAHIGPARRACRSRAVRARDNQAGPFAGRGGDAGRWHTRTPDPGRAVRTLLCAQALRRREDRARADRVRGRARIWRPIWSGRWRPSRRMPTVVVLERCPGRPPAAGAARRPLGGWQRSGRWPDRSAHLARSENAIAMTAAIAAALIKADPAHASLYAANRDRASRRSESARKASCANDLAPLHGRPYLVFHDAYRYFEHRFGLSPLGAVTVAPDRPVGPRRIETLRRAILEGRSNACSTSRNSRHASSIR